MDGISLLTITVLAVFVGFEVVSKVSSTLHTPLMSGANAIHGIILVGAIIVAGQAADPWVLAVALLAVVLATANLVGGFVVTDRMLEMFRARRPQARPAGDPGDGRRRAGEGEAGDLLDPTWTALLYLVAAVCFILALKGLNSPAHRPARQPDRRVRRARGRGHGVPVGAGWTTSRGSWAPSRSGRGRRPVARRVKMTQMPQLVALFNGVGGGAAALVALLELPHADAVGAAGRRRSRCWWARCPSPAPAVTFAKLQELMTTRPVMFPGLPVLMGCVLLAAGGRPASSSS